MTEVASGIAFEAAGDGPVVICLHGIGGDASSFHHQVGAMPGYRIIAWNMPGYKSSPALPAPVTFEKLSHALGELITELGETEVHLVGQSIGGMIALEHYCRRPDQVASLTLVATTPRFGGRDESFKTAFLTARLAPLNQGMSMAAMAADAAPRLVGPGTPASEINVIETALADVPEQTWRDILACLVQFDRAADLSSIHCPVLICAGGADANAPAKTMRSMASKIPGAHYFELETAGHMLHQEQPDAFNSRLLEFLSEVTSHHDRSVD